MAQLLVRNLEDQMKEKLRALAIQHGISMEEEARDILRNALIRETAPKPLGQQIRQLFSGTGFSSEEGIPEFRGSLAEPVTFE